MSMEGDARTEKRAQAEGVALRAEARWAGGMKVRVASRGHEISVDEPSELGGEDTAMNPMELLLGALGACVTLMCVAFAPKFRVKVRDARATIEGDFDPRGFQGLADVRYGFSRVRLDLRLDAEGDERDVERLAHFAFERCPVSDTLRGVEVEKRLVRE
ncbi:MAG: OsmC family protein [Brockia lithotrophica]|uniref:OsmC family protein n=1 Tax=Brockia lithotrophica TaxID=933949 RepID=A0A2T5G712_9BACL|nr:MAG: OsmC family protein [Brockia lithotrophica]